jgi:hypothetical protein
MLLRCVSNLASVRCLLLARRVGGACEENMLGAVGSLGAAGPVMCRLSPWTLLITTLEADIGWLLRLASPGKLVDWCGRPTSVLCDAPIELGDT